MCSGLHIYPIKPETGLPSFANFVFSKISVAEPHHFYAAPDPGENFDEAPTPAPTLLHTKSTFLNKQK
jgi:hypothetical protein